MTGIFSIVSNFNAGMFRLNQTARPWDDDGKASSLAEKADAAQQSFSLDPAFLRGAQAAKTAMEEALKIGSPKASAQDRIARAEQRLKEIQQEVRLALACGDRNKLTALAREAALLARQAGRAAKEYASGIAAAAAMGVGGDAAQTAANGGTMNGAGAGVLALSTSTTVSASSSTVQIRQIELSLSLTIHTDGAGGTGDGVDGAGGSSAGGSTIVLTASAESLTAEASTVSVTASAQSEDLLKRLGLPSEIKLDGLPQAVSAGLAESGQAIGGFGTPAGRQLLNAMIQDNEAKASRYREADTFARRVEGVINGVKSVIGQAKAANLSEPDEKRKAERRKMLDDLEKGLDDARAEANKLRAAAYGSSDAVTRMTSGTTGGADAATSDTAGTTAADTATTDTATTDTATTDVATTDMGGNDGDVGGIDTLIAGDVSADVASQPLVDITA